MRDGSLGLGATRSETIKRVILPAALPGIVGALLLTASRAIGETMIVVLAAGVAANLTLNPFEPMTTITVKIVNQLTGDLEFNSPQTLVAFALGLTLFVITLVHEHLRALHRAQISGAVRMTDTVFNPAGVPRAAGRAAISASSAATPPNAASGSTALPPSPSAWSSWSILLFSIVSQGLHRLPADRRSLCRSSSIAEGHRPGQQAGDRSEGADHRQLSDPRPQCAGQGARHRSRRQAGARASWQGLRLGRRRASSCATWSSPIPR